MTEGLTAIMKDYATALEATGMSSQRAVTAAGSIIGAMGKMSMAQKSFLSSQTGGPGGLLGAVQIEKMLREGKTAEVAEKIQMALKRQFGGQGVVTQADVRDEASAAAFERQRLMLTSGTFGIKAKDEDEATNMLEAIKSGNLGKDLGQAGMGLKGKEEEGGVNFFYKKGLEVAQTSGGTLHQIVSSINE